MNKKLLACSALLLLSSVNISFAAIVKVDSCGLINSNTAGCNECFQENVNVYGCNPQQASCQKEGLTSMFDDLTNTGNTQRVQWIDGIGPGTIEEYELQTNADWMISNDPIYEMPSNFGPVYSANNGDRYTIYEPGATKRWTQMKTASYYRFDRVTGMIDKTKPVFRVDFVPKTQVVTSTNPTVLAAAESHRQCIFYNASFCGDGIIDNGSNATKNKGEQCDDGNMIDGDGCSSICTTETTPTLSCNNLTLAPTTVSKDGGNITATCTATNATGYKFVLKQGSTVIQTRDYLNTSTATLALPANATPNGKVYTVDCYVKNATQSDIEGANCNKSITVSGTTPVQPSVCNSLTLSHTTIQTNTPVNYICSATNATSYIIKEGLNILGTQPEGTFNFPTAGTYSIGCFIDGKTTTPVSCAKSITVTNPPVSPIPSIFIDKDDSTPGTPDSDGNDTQRVQNNGTATFTIRVVNNGNEALKTVVIDDSLSSDCARTSTQTAALYAGGATANFDVNESFNYQCTKTNVTASTFPNNRNTASVKGVGVTSSTNVTDSDVTEIIIKQLNPSIIIEKDDDDNSDDEQEIDEGDTAKFSVKVTNNGDEALENVFITDELSRDCEKDESETRDLIRTVGNRDSLFDPDEVFTYTCQEKSVQTDTFPDEINTVCTQANGVDTDRNVDDCDDTNIITNKKVENLMCLNIESSKGSFGGAPFRTTITCDAIDYDSCEIEVMLDGEVIDTYNACTQSLTLSEKGNYSVACIINNERTPDCEMEIEVAAMTDIPTGTKIFILAFLSMLLTALGTHLYKKKIS